MDPGFFHRCPVPGQEAQTGTQQVLSEHQEALHYAGDGALARTAQRCRGVSLLGDI